jgi:hypothetical protein
MPTVSMAANASPRGQRAAILSSKLSDLGGFYLAVEVTPVEVNGEGACDRR